MASMIAFAASSWDWVLEPLEPFVVVVVVDAPPVVVDAPPVVVEAPPVVVAASPVVDALPVTFGGDVGVGVSLEAGTGFGVEFEGCWTRLPAKSE
jgi:hypothetical protein